MATLANVIGRGLAAAKPASPAEGYLYYSTDSGLLERYSGSAWESVSGGGGAGLVYKFSTTTADADPGAGIVRFNHGTPASVTVLYVDDTVLGGSVDLSTWYADLAAGDRFFIQQADDPAKFLLAKVASVADGTGYYKITVTIEDSGTLPDDAATLVFTLLVKGGGGGGGSSNWWDADQVNVISWNVFHDGDILNSLGQLGQLQTGTADNDGATGAGGFTEVQVGCSTFYDLSPSANAGRGWVIFDQDVRADAGHYCRISARFCVEDDQHFTVGFHPSNTSDGPDTKITDGSAYFYKKDTGANWFARSADGTAGEETDTGVAWATGDWRNFEIYVFDDGGTMTAMFWIDGVLVATHTTRVPLAATTLGQLSCRSHFKTGGATGTYDTVIFCPGAFWASKDDGVLAALGYATL